MASDAQDVPAEPAALRGWNEARGRDNSLALALDATLTSIWDYDVAANRVALDRNWSRMLGGPPTETVVPIRRMFDLIHPHDRKRALSASFACLSGQTEEYSQEYRIRGQRGDWVWVHSRGRVMGRSADGRATRMIGTNIDVSQRKSSELAASRQVEFLQALNQTTLALLQRRGKSEILEALAGRAADLLDSTQVEVALIEGEELVTHAYGGEQSHAGQDRATRREAVLSWRAIDSREPVVVENFSALPEAAPAYRKAQFHSVAVFPILHGTRCLGVLAFLRDRRGRAFTAEEHAKGALLAQLAALVIHNAAIYEDALHIARERSEALLQQERIFRNFVENINQGFYTTNRLGVFLYCNPAISAVTGWTEEELHGSCSFRLTAPEQRAQVIAHYRRLAASTENNTVMEFEVETKAGRRLTVEQTTHVLRGPDGAVREYRNFLRDISARKQAEAALRESESKFKGVFDASPIPILLLSYPEGRVQAINQATEDLFGYTAAEALNRTTAELNVWPEPALRERFMQQLRNSGRLQAVEVEMRRKDGRLIQVLYSVSTITLADRACMLASVIDVTAQKQAETALRKSEAQLRQAQKMESLGTLAGGIAHDFNNILTGILGYAQLGLSDIEPQHPASQWLDGILKSGERAKGLVQQILRFSRKAESSRAPTRLQAVVKESADLLRSTLPAMVRLDCRLDPACPPVLADATEIHQIVLNLCTNAWHALPDTGGHIEIDLAPLEVTGAFASDHPPLQPGAHVRLTVRDNGRGMNAATLERIFEPFFTTKEAGKGTGLGLSVVHSVVASHGGAILVHSTPGRGTLFEIFLPALTVPAARSDGAHPANVPRGRGEAILVVDDDRMSGDVIASLIKRLGYHPTLCSDPFQAVALLYANPYAALVTDLAMPGLPGDELSRQALVRNPALPILLLSGFIEPGKQEELRQLGVREVLGKPPAYGDLGAALGRCLQG